jgi:hypothetical protein
LQGRGHEHLSGGNHAPADHDPRHPQPCAKTCS